MKQLPSFLCAIFLCISIPLFSQTIDLDETSGYTVWEVTGKVSYSDATGKKMLKPGMTVPEDAMLHVSKKSSVRLTKDGNSVAFDKKGSYNLSTDAAAATVKNQSETMQDFMAMVVSAKGYSTLPGGTSPTDTVRKRTGWGDKDELLLLSPISGKFLLRKTNLEWNGLKNATSYRLIIYGENKANPVLSVLATGTAFTVDPFQLDLKTGQTYHAQVMLPGDESSASPKVTFTVVSAQEEKSALTMLMQDPAYKKSSATQKLLMEAVTLEKKGLKTLAEERYRMAMEKDAGNLMAQQMYAAFLDRNKNKN